MCVSACVCVSVCVSVCMSVRVCIHVHLCIQVCLCVRRGVRLANQVAVHVLIKPPTWNLLIMQLSPERCLCFRSRSKAYSLDRRSGVGGFSMTHWSRFLLNGYQSCQSSKLVIVLCHCIMSKKHFLNFMCD